MSYSLRALLLLMITLFVAHIHAATLLEYNKTITDPNVSSNPHCYGDEHSVYHPGTLDCLQARDYVPKGTILGVFHKNGAADGFKLPLSFSTRTCTIIIDLESNIPEFSTWKTVTLATTTLIHSCSQGWGPDAKTGGYSHVGQGEQIRISLLKIRSDDPIFDNITASAATS